MTGETTEEQKPTAWSDTSDEFLRRTMETLENLDKEARELLGAAFTGVPEAKFYRQRSFADLDPRAGLGSFRALETLTVTVPVENRGGEVLAITVGDGPTKLRALTEERSRAVLGGQIEAPATQPGVDIGQEERLNRLFRTLSCRSYLGGPLIMDRERVDPTSGRSQHDSHSILVLPVWREMAPKNSHSMANIAATESGGVKVTVATQVPNRGSIGWTMV